MTHTAHEEYAKQLLLSLSPDDLEIGGLAFVPNSSQSRNAAKAMTAILCNRLFRSSRHQPVLKANTTYEWKNGIFNCRNIADRSYFLTNMRRDVADAIHLDADSQPVAYLFACVDPLESDLCAWTLPEPVLFDSLSSLDPKASGVEYTVQIRPAKQRIEHYALSPDLEQYFRRFQLSPLELQVLNESRRIDAAVKLERKIAKANKVSDDEGSASHSAIPGAADPILALPEFDVDESYPEGRELLRLHRQKERNRMAVNRKKRAVLQSEGRLLCEVCEFDLALIYGVLGHGFAECHHRVPLAYLKDGHRIRLSELAVVCANCHRMLHRRPWHNVEQLRKLVCGRRALD